MEYTYFQGGNRLTYQEMRQKPLPRDTFFSLKNDSQILQRPTSVATEFVDTDWEEEQEEDDDEEIISDVEDNSPRLSLQSSGQPSFTTISSFDEVPTPRSSGSQVSPAGYSPKQVEGPRGPHLFRNSSDIYYSSASEDEIILTLSPITPKAPRAIADLLAQPQQPQQPRRASPFQYTDEELDPAELASWTTEMVAQSMLNAGIELSVADRFMENDISGAILITLKFEDLKELNIQSFGIRTKVWHKIQALRDSRPASPRAATPIEDAPSRDIMREARRREESTSRTSRRRPSSSKRRPRTRQARDDITPMESVSIIGIEQVIPKPHHCSKGENCSKWKKQQQLIRAFKKEYPNVDISAGGKVVIGDTSHPETAKALDPNQLRPVSDAVPSVVASSDVLGPGVPPLQYLQEANLRDVQQRDPQDNVMQFLNFQHQHLRECGNDVPPTPPFAVLPTAQAQLPHQGLRRLPKLSIPGKTQPVPSRMALSRASSVSSASPEYHTPQQQKATQQATQQAPFVPYRMDKVDPVSPDLETPRNTTWRHGTPFSELDVPVTAVPIGPVARDFSQSVPPDMSYRADPATLTQHTSPPRCQSRTARRPSFPLMPALEENRPIPAARISTPHSASPRTPRVSRSQQPLQPPPRDTFPFSRGQLNASEKVLPAIGSRGKSPAADPANGISHQGPMKKRKTKMLRHEWQDGYFTLKGTRLNMHKDADELDRTLEYVDIDDYAIACSSLASSSKLSAAFKTMHLSHGRHSREKSDPVGAFAFQLIPQDKNSFSRLRKRDSNLHASNAIPADGVNGTGKTHHFAVKSRDDRIDWMRELMLAKALRQKGEGFEISVNGNMI